MHFLPSFYIFTLFFSYGFEACRTHSEFISVFKEVDLYVTFIFFLILLFLLVITIIIFIIPWVFFNFINFFVIFIFFNLKDVESQLQRNYGFFIDLFLDILTFEIKLSDFLGFSFFNFWNSLTEDGKFLFCCFILYLIFEWLMQKKKIF
jgi:hypothetical protein